MSTTLKSKMNYLIGIFHNYYNWPYIIFCRIVNKPIEKVVIRSGTTITGGYKSLAIDIVDEIFIRKVYTPAYLSINKGDTVVDIGSNIGVFSLFAALNGASHVYSVEPLIENIDYLKTNFKINNMKAPKIIHAAISRIKGVSRLYVPDCYSHSRLTKDKDILSQNNYRVVKTINLNEFVRSMALKKIDFLKIDCEGSEGDIVSSTTRETWEKIGKIAIEYHNNVSVLSNSKISAKLVSYGFNVKTAKSDDLYGYIYAWR